MPEPRILTPEEHGPLPEGHWWACERPEHPPAEYVQHYRAGCARCYPAWRAAAADPRRTFFFAGDPTARSLHPGIHTETEIRAWFMKEKSDA